MIQFLSKLMLKFSKSTSRKNYYLIVLLLTAATTQARNYYVSTSGNNSNDGFSPATAWQTITKVNSFNFSANDYILFNRGDIFYGGIIVKRAYLNYGAYGSGVKPVISGLSTVTGWVNLGGNIWEAPVTNVKIGVNLVLRDGVIQQVGRYPNADDANGGYLVYTASTTNSVTGSAQSTTTNWTGAEIAIRLNRWEIIRQKVTAHSGGVVTFTTNLETPRLNYGYFFQRDSRTLDKDGEWWHNAPNQKLRMYFSSNNPSTYNIQIATVDTLFKSLYGSLSVSDLSFAGSGKKSIFFNGGTGVIIKNCDVKNSGSEAITVSSTNNVTVDNCTTTNSLGSGIKVINLNTSTVNLVVKNCTVINTAYLAGMETSNENNGGAGITCYGGNGITIQNNSVTNSGYVGIAWQGNDVFVKYNFVNRFCTLRDDGGGIYTVEKAGSDLPIRTNRNLIGNILINGLGNNNGTNDPKGTSARGLYFDLGTRTVVADSNTVAFVVGGGFHGNNNASLTIKNNVLFGNGKGYSLQRFADAALVRNMVITKNIIYPFRFEYRNLGINTPSLTLEADISAMGKLDSNYYSVKSLIDTSLIGITTNADNTSYKGVNNPFTYLTGTVGIEKNSKNIVNTGSLEYNASNTPKVVYFSGFSKKDVFGNVYNDSVTIPAWKSKVLILNGITTAPNKAPLANAGANIVITLPTNSVSLSGTGTDTDGTIASYAWAKISGPSAGTILSPAAATTAINSLVEGIYQYVLNVTDNSGAIGKDTIQVTVNPLVGNNVMKSAAVESAVNCSGTSSIVTVSANGGLSPYSGTGSFKTNAGKGSLKISFPIVSTTQTSIYASVGKIIAGKTYILNFSTLGTYNNAQITIQLKKYVSPYTMLATYQTTTFGTSIKNHQIIFTPTVSDSSARIDLLLTQNSGTIYLDNIAFFEATPTGELISNNIITKGQFETDISAIRFWSPNGNQLMEWDNTSKISNINYYTITDAAGAKSTVGLTIKQPAAVLTAAVTSGALNVVTVTASGGASPYTGTGTFTAIVGLNTFIVKDANGCSGTASINIAKLAARISNTSTSTNVTPVLDELPLSNKLQISSYPNPTTSTFKLLVEGKINEKINIVVMSEDGRIVFQTAGITNKTYEFGSNFIRGLYIIKVIQGIEIQTIKVIKV